MTHKEDRHCGQNQPRMKQILESSDGDMEPDIVTAFHDSEKLSRDMGDDKEKTTLNF